MVRSVKVLAGVLVLAATALGCSSGLSEEAATSRCNEEKKAYGSQQGGGCFPDDSFDACVSCYMECGDSCAVAESCPVQYVCSNNDSSDDGDATASSDGNSASK